MKKFEIPEAQVVQIDITDIITTSPVGGNGTQLPDQGFGE